MAGLDGKLALIIRARGMRAGGHAAALKPAGRGTEAALTDLHRKVEDLHRARPGLAGKASLACRKK